MQFIRQFVSMEKKISEEKGDFNLFALILRDDSIDIWDLVISADWVLEDRKKSLDYFVDQIKRNIGEDVLLNLSRIVLLDPNESFVLAMNKFMRTEHNNIDLDSLTLNNIYIKKAFLITSKQAKEFVKTS